MNERYCDFHLHSDCSDGRLTPAALVDAVASAGVEVMALTDHDTVEGLATATQRAKSRGIAFVGGIEMTSYAAPDVVHVLGLGLQASEPLIEINAVARAVWAENERRWIESLAARRFAVSLERDFPDLPVRLPVLIERLCLRGIDGGDPKAVHARFRSFFRSLPPQAFERLPSPARAARAIRSCGGLAALAHPGRLDPNAAATLAADLDAIEADYAAYDGDTRERLRELARTLGKIHTCGSDYHGYFTPDYENPRFVAPPELLARLRVPA
jgi:3',5'-nucleoside bisphosphate phosphatase